MTVNQTRTGKTIRLPPSLQVLRRRAGKWLMTPFLATSLACPATVPSTLVTRLARAKPFNFAPIPALFRPNIFARLINSDIGKQKQFAKGLEQLGTEGAVSDTLPGRCPAPRPDTGGRRSATVLRSCRRAWRPSTTSAPGWKMLPHQLARWVEGPEKTDRRAPLALWHDENRRPGRPPWSLCSAPPHELSYYSEKYPDIQFLATANQTSDG